MPLQLAMDFLSKLGIPTEWVHAQFSEIFKMSKYLEATKHIRIDPSLVIYHTDLDELVTPKQIKKALHELESGTCDAIRGDLYVMTTHSPTIGLSITSAHSVFPCLSI